MNLLNKITLSLIGLLTCNALDLRNFDPTGSGSKGAPKIATYLTGDNTATVVGAGYFNALSSVLKTGDCLYVVSSDGVDFYKVSVSGSVVTIDNTNAFA